MVYLPSLVHIMRFSSSGVKSPSTLSKSHIYMSDGSVTETTTEARKDHLCCCCQLCAMLNEELRVAARYAVEVRAQK